MKIIKCEICSGAGIIPGKVCAACNGAGIAVADQYQAVYFGSRIDRDTLRAEAVRRAMRSIFLGITALFGAAGIAALVYEAWPEVARLFEARFWNTQGNGKLIFSFSLFADLYLIVSALRKNEGRAMMHPVFRHPERSEEPALSLSKGSRGSARTSVRDSSPATPDQNDKVTGWKEVQQFSKARRIDVTRAFSDDVRRRVREAYALAFKAGHLEVAPAHIISALFSSGPVASLMARLEIDVRGLQERLLHVLKRAPSPDPTAVGSPSPAGRGVVNRPSPLGRGEGEGDPSFGELAKKVFIAAYLEAQKVGAQQVQPYHVFLETVAADKRLQEIFFDLGVEKQQLKNAVRWFEINDTLRARLQRFRGAASRRPKGAMNRAMTALETRFLDRYSDDLTRLAGRGYLEWTVDREKEFDAIFRVLQGERKSIVLVGPYGVGKEAILNGIAERMVEEEVPDLLKDRRLVALSIPKLVAGATPSEAQERLLTCLNDLARARNIVLAIENVHEFVGGREGGLDLSEVLSGELGKGYFIAIATTTPDEYRARLEGTELGNVLTKVEIEEPSFPDAIQILESKAGAIEYRSKVYFSYSALEKAVVLSDRYIKDRPLPEKAIDIAKEAAQYAFNKRGAKTLTRGEDVAEVISQRSHVPVTAVTETEADKLLHLEQVMHERIVGQDEAVRAVAAALRRARAELREGKRPIANFLFLGPTGVGKTETAKTVAAVYFGNEERMIRVDMSEYQTKDGVARLLGAPGEKGGLLSEPVRKSPFSLVLLDEIEKAHPDILNVFLQIMDDGRATDSAGRVVDFTNTIIIATSNAGTQFVQEALKGGQDMGQIKNELMDKELKQYFKPEFLNRFDGIVVYRPLTEQEIREVAQRMIAAVAKQIEKKGITLRATDEAVAELAHAGFDPKFGARPLRRVIQERVQDALANLLLEKKLGRRDTVVLEKGGELRVKKAERL